MFTLMVAFGLVLAFCLYLPVCEVYELGLLLGGRPPSTEEVVVRFVEVGWTLFFGALMFVACRRIRKQRIARHRVANKPWQISLAHLFAVVTCFAVSFGSATAIGYLDAQPSAESLPLACLLWSLVFICPFLGLGILVKHPWAGLTIGLLIATMMIAPTLQVARE
jgi:hypothetical protein